MHQARAGAGPVTDSYLELPADTQAMRRTLAVAEAPLPAPWRCTPPAFVSTRAPASPLHLCLHPSSASPLPLRRARAPSPRPAAPSPHAPACPWPACLPPAGPRPNFYSHKGAPGLVIATGNVGPHLDFKSGAPPACLPLLPADCCLPPAAGRLPPAACRQLPAACCLPPAACRLLPPAELRGLIGCACPCLGGTAPPPTGNRQPHLPAPDRQSWWLAAQRTH